MLPGISYRQQKASLSCATLPRLSPRKGFWEKFVADSILVVSLPSFFAEIFRPDNWRNNIIHVYKRPSKMGSQIYTINNELTPFVSAHNFKLLAFLCWKLQFKCPRKLKIKTLFVRGFNSYTRRITIIAFNSSKSIILRIVICLL